MSDLPAGWTLSTLEKLAVNPTADIVDGPFGSNLKASEYQEEGIPIIRLQNVKRSRFIDKNIKYVSSEKAKELQRHSFVAGDLVITKLGDPLGEAAIVPEKFKNGIIVADIVRARLDTNLADKKYVMYVINSPEVIKSLENEVKGTTRPRVNLGHIRRLEFPLAPLNEQKRIAIKLDSLLARVDSCQTHLERVPQILKRFRQSVLAAATSGRLTEEWRDEKGVNGEWKKIILEEVAKVVDPHPSHRTPKEHLDGVPYVGIGDIKEDGTFDFEKARKISPEVFEEHKQRYQIENGDFVFGKIGTLGKATPVPVGVDYTLSANVILIQPNKTLTESKYIMYFLQSPATMADITEQSVSTSQSAFGIKKMRTLELSLPSLEEQGEIVRRVEKLFAYADRLEARYTSASEHVERLTPSLLAKAFRGELVEQDPNDESAEKLLERIREAIAKAPKESKKSQRRTDMKSSKSKQEGKRIGIVEALKDAGIKMTSEQLFIAAGFPSDAEPDLVEEFFVEIRDALEKKQITRDRKSDVDWFSFAY